MIPVDQLRSIAEEAGRAILDVYAAGPAAAQVTIKSDASPLTLADRRSHEVIAAALAACTPDTPVRSEEDPSAIGPMPARYWLVDPLDGTKEFIKRTDEFTVNIALVERGCPVLGVVHAPALGRSWIGGPEGAWRVQAGEAVPIRVDSDPAMTRLRIVASRDHAGPQVTAMLARLPGATAVPMGSSLKFCLLADGQADLYLRDGPTMEWDTAAAHAVLRAAGGEVYTLDARPLAYGKCDLRNPPFVAVGSRGLEWRGLIGAG